MPAFRLHAAALALATLPTFAPAAPLTLAEALDRATARSEAARAAAAGVAGARETARAAGQWPDPMVRAGVDNLPVTGADRLHTARDSMTMKRIGISQEWVSSDKRSLRQTAAQAVVGRQVTAVQMALADVRLRTALAYLDAWFAEESAALATLAERQAREEADAARARLATASGSSAEASALVAARGVAEDESAELAQQRAAAVIALERWTGVAADELAPFDVEADAGESRFVARHPLVLTAGGDAEVARQAALLAATNRRPNWTWEVAYGQRTGYSDMVSFGVTIPLTLAPEERQDRDTAAKNKAVDQAESTLAEAVRAATADYRTLAGEARHLTERIGRYRTAVVAPAQRRTAGALAAYGSNQGTLAALFEARRAEVEAQRKLLGLRRDLARMQAQLAYTPIAAGAAR